MTITLEQRAARAVTRRCWLSISIQTTVEAERARLAAHDAEMTVYFDRSERDALLTVNALHWQAVCACEMDAAEYERTVVSWTGLMRGFVAMATPIGRCDYWHAIAIKRGWDDDRPQSWQLPAPQPTEIQMELIP